MKRVGRYMLPDNAVLVGYGYLGCLFCNDAGEVYAVRIIEGVQHFRLMPVTLRSLKQGVKLHEV